MDSPLVPTLSIFYISHVENHVSNNFSKPSIFTRFIDDIFIPTTSLDEIKKNILTECFENKCVQHFPYGINIIDRILLLDVLDEANSEKFIILLYKKTQVNILSSL